MQPTSLERSNGPHPYSITLRDVVAVLFRQRRPLIISFFLVLLAVALSGVLRPSYKSEMKLLVRRERMDPIVTSQSNAPAQVAQEEITESELNSEVELIGSSDSLRKVVLANGLQNNQRSLRSLFGQFNEQMRIEKAVRLLSDQVKAEPLRKTSMIVVSFESGDPQLSERVLNSVAGSYLEKHLQMHRPGGEFKFFDQETEQLRKELGSAESQLTDFTQKNGVVSAQLERDLTLQKANDLDASLSQSEAAIAETNRRIQTLEQQRTTIPARTVTQLKSADNAQLLQQMKSTLLQLELKRSELLAKFEPTYRPVVDLEKQIGETRAAIAGEKDAPVRDETTDQNPPYQWVQSELAKARTDLSGLQARATAQRAALDRYRRGARSLQQAAIVQQGLQRTVKAEEDNYLLYLRKQEEARMNDALDRGGILNVVMAEPPTTPALPSRSILSYSLLGLLLAFTGSIGLAFAADFMNSSFRTPDDVTTFLGSPVLASIPKGVQ